MDNKYITLFKELARATAVSAEQVMEYNHQKEDEKGEETARIMRDDFQNLYDKISAADFDGNFTKAEYAKLLVGSYVTMNQVKDKIAALKRASAGYETDLIPKLQKVIDASDEEYQKIAEENFIIENSN